MTIGRHCGLSTIYIRDNLFHQKNQGENLSSKTQTLLSSSLLWGDARQYAQCKTGVRIKASWLVLRRNVCHLLIELSPRTDDQLRHCKNTGSIPSKFYIFKRLKLLKSLDDKHKKHPSFPSVPIVLPLLQKSFPSVLPKRFYQVFLRMHWKNAWRNLQSIKRHHVTKFRNEVLLFCLRRKVGSSEEIFLHLKKFYNSWKLIIFPWSTICVEMEQFVLVPASVYIKFCNTQSVTKQKFQDFQVLQNPTYQIESFKKDENKKFFDKADKILSFPRIKLSNSQTLVLGGVETCVLLCKNANVPDFLIAFFDAAGVSPTLVLNQITKTKKREEVGSSSICEHQKLQKL